MSVRVNHVAFAMSALLSAIHNTGHFHVPCAGCSYRPLAPELMAQRERYAAPRRNDSADKICAVLSMESACHRAPWLIIKISTETNAVTGIVPDISTIICGRHTRRKGHPARKDGSGWTVTDEVPITETEIEVFEAWFGDLFNELFSTRHPFGLEIAMTTPEFAALYLRISTGRQAENDLSIPSVRYQQLCQQNCGMLANSIWTWVNV